LRSFPIDELKVDRAFVDGLGRNPGDTAIGAAVTAMSHALELSVVAEGVETSEQLERLRVLGCEFAQGPLGAATAGWVHRAASRRSGACRFSAAIWRAARTGPIQGDRARDSSDVRQLAQMSLASTGFQVFTATNGEDAIALAREHRPACVVLDHTIVLKPFSPRDLVGRVRGALRRRTTEQATAEWAS
jgi:hypothetical protein